jgi:hypothetical protein
MVVGVGFQGRTLLLTPPTAVGSGALGDWLDSSGSLDLKQLKIAAAKQVTEHATVARSEKPHT